MKRHNECCVIAIFCDQFYTNPDVDFPFPSINSSISNEDSSILMASV